MPVFIAHKLIVRLFYTVKYRKAHQEVQSAETLPSVSTCKKQLQQKKTQCCRRLGKLLPHLFCKNISAKANNFLITHLYSYSFPTHTMLTRSKVFPWHTSEKLCTLPQKALSLERKKSSSST